MRMAHGELLRSLSFMDWLHKYKKEATGLRRRTEKVTTIVRLVTSDQGVNSVIDFQTQFV